MIKKKKKECRNNGTKQIMKKQNKTKRQHRREDAKLVVQTCHCSREYAIGIHTLCHMLLFDIMRIFDLYKQTSFKSLDAIYHFPLKRKSNRDGSIERGSGFHPRPHVTLALFHWPFISFWHGIFAADLLPANLFQSSDWSSYRITSLFSAIPAHRLIWFGEK